MDGSSLRIARSTRKVEVSNSRRRSVTVVSDWTSKIAGSSVVESSSALSWSLYGSGMLCWEQSD